jgi:hypothetical protein
MLKENLNFHEAVTMLAKQVGVTIPASESPFQQEKERRVSFFREINILARDYFRQTLNTHSRQLTPENTWKSGRLPRNCKKNFNWDMLCLNGIPCLLFWRVRG